MATVNITFLLFIQEYVPLISTTQNLFCVYFFHFFSLKKLKCYRPAGDVAVFRHARNKAIIVLLHVVFLPSHLFLGVVMEIVVMVEGQPVVHTVVLHHQYGLLL